MAATVFRRSHSLTGVEILDLRHFSSADLRPLLTQEVESWGSLLCWDYRSSAEMILRYIDAKILPGYAAVERGNIVGYSFFVYEGSKGVMGDLFVSPRRHAPDRIADGAACDRDVAAVARHPSRRSAAAHASGRPPGGGIHDCRISALSQIVPFADAERPGRSGDRGLRVTQRRASPSLERAGLSAGGGSDHRGVSWPH